MAEIFGTDGVRGEVGSPHITPEAFATLGAATALHVQNESGREHPVFVVGGDTRSSSPELRGAVIFGLESVGARAVDIGVAPTPTIAWLARENEAAAVAVTASHNPDSDNGFKPFGIGGDKINGDALDDIERRYRGRRGTVRPRSGSGMQQAFWVNSEAHVDAITRRFGDGVLEGHTVVIDAANGAAHELGPRLFRKLGAEVIEFATDPKAAINDGAGAASLGGLTERVAGFEGRDNPRFLGGFAFDGDGDRVMGIDRLGREINGNHWLSRLAIEQTGVVGTVYTNSGLVRHVKGMGVEFAYCGNGDIQVTNGLRERGWQRGGEFTGHLIDLEHLSSGDGLYMAALMAVDLARTGRTLTDVYDELPLWPETMRGIVIAPGTDAQAILEGDRMQAVQQGIEEEFGSDARTVVRASGTEPKIRVWAEAVEPGASEEIVRRLSAVIGEAA